MAGDQKSLLKVLFILHLHNITFSGCWDDYKSFKSVLNLAWHYDLLFMEWRYI